MSWKYFTKVFIFSNKVFCKCYRNHEMNQVLWAKKVLLLKSRSYEYTYLSSHYTQDLCVTFEPNLRLTRFFFINGKQFHTEQVPLNNSCFKLARIFLNWRGKCGSPRSPLQVSTVWTQPSLSAAITLAEILKIEGKSLKLVPFSQSHTGQKKMFIKKRKRVGTIADYYEFLTLEYAH